MEFLAIKIQSTNLYFPLGMKKENFSLSFFYDVSNMYILRFGLVTFVFKN